MLNQNTSYLFDEYLFSIQIHVCHGNKVSSFSTLVFSSFSRWSPVFLNKRLLESFWFLNKIFIYCGFTWDCKQGSTMLYFLLYQGRLHCVAFFLLQPEELTKCCNYRHHSTLCSPCSLQKAEDEWQWLHSSRSEMKNCWGVKAWKWKGRG